MQLMKYTELSSIIAATNKLVKKIEKLLLEMQRLLIYYDKEVYDLKEEKRNLEINLAVLKIVWPFLKHFYHV